MIEAFTSWKRVFVYFFLIILITVVGNLGGWIMGLVLGLIFTLLIELFSFIRNDTERRIEKELSRFGKTVREQIASLKEFHQLAEKLKTLNVQMNSSALSRLADLYGTGLTGKTTPVFLLNSSVEPGVVIEDAGVTLLLLNATQAISLFTRSFDFVQQSYLGVSYTRPATWEFASIDESLCRQKELVERGVDIRRVFICGDDDPKEKVLHLCEIQKKKYGVNCKYIDFDTIKSKPPLHEAWKKLWPYYLGKSEVEKFVLLSPDFGIIDNEIVISYLLDSMRHHIGAALFFRPSFLDQAIEYYQHLFHESRMP